jgi:hypothetical protein
VEAGGQVAMWDNLAVRLVVGLMVAVLGLLLLLPWLRGRRGRTAGGEAPPRGPAPPDDAGGGPSLPAGPGGPVMPGGDPPPVPPIPPPVPPVPPPAGPVPPPPGGCADGDEEWRTERGPSSFLVPPPDGKVRITASPSTPALDAFIDGFGLPRGVPLGDFVAVDDEALDRLLDGLPVAPVELHWRLEFELHEFRLECQRKWLCEDGAWVPTDERRLVESGPDPHLARYVVDGPARTIADVRRAWREAQVALNGAEANIAAREAFRAAC